MELYPFHRQRLVPEPHDLVARAVGALRPGRRLEAVGEALRLHDQRVIARRRERRRQLPEHALAAMVDLRGLAMHDLARAHHLAAESLADALVAQADAEDRELALERVDQL